MFSIDRTMSQDKDRWQYESSKCPYRGLKGEVIQHYLQLEIGPVEVPYICNDCGYQIHKRGKAWTHRSKVHGDSRHERLEHICSGSFRDLAIEDMVKHPAFLKPRGTGASK